MKVTKEEIKTGLKNLGVKEGDHLLVHSSLSSLGEVEGGCDTVIEALIETVGPEGTIVMPTLTFEEVFDLEKSPSTVGKITEVFRKKRGVVRSLHPIHSVAAWGKYAHFLTENHIIPPAPYGEDTPYFKMTEIDGSILLLGVDQDRNTSLHTVEALANAPYLTTITRKYKDLDGVVKEKVIEKMAGPHRDFIGVDKILRASGIMRIGKIGRAVCRLMKSKKMIELLLKKIKENPFLMLCDNPACFECVEQKALVRKHQLAQEDFKLSALSDNAGQYLEEIITNLKEEGIEYLELNKINFTHVFSLFGEAKAKLTEIKKELEKNKISVSAIHYERGKENLNQLIDLAYFFNCSRIIIPFSFDLKSAKKIAEGEKILICLENTEERMKKCVEILQELNSPYLQMAFNPAHFALGQDLPFRRYTKVRMKKYLKHLYLNDATFSGKYVLLGQGNGEIKELISILRCSSFDQFFTLNTKLPFKESMRSFWYLLENM